MAVTQNKRPAACKVGKSHIDTTDYDTFSWLNSFVEDLSGYVSLICNTRFTLPTE